MRTGHVILLCILGAALLSSVMCKHEIGPEGCCFTFYPSRVNKRFISSYYLTDERCPKNGVILVTHKKREICADVTLPWVVNIMKKVDEMSF